MAWPPHVLEAADRFWRLAYWRAKRRGMWKNLGEPEDAAQEAALAALELAGTVADAHDFGALLWRRVARRLWERHYRGRVVLMPTWAARERRYRGLAPEEGPLPRDELAAPEPAEGEESPFAAGLREALAGLPGGDRAVLEQRYGLGGGPRLTYREIARRAGITENAARNRRQSALRRLRGGLGRADDGRG